MKGYPSPVSTNPRVFLARLNSLGIFDPNGDQMGKVRDAIVVLRTGNLPARLTGLVVEVPPRRRIFVPMTKVTTIDSGQIIVTGTVNLRRFEQRKNETLVTAELLDRTVALQASGEPVTIIDVGVEISPELDQVEGILGALAVKLLQTTGLVWELVFDLSNVHRLKDVGC